MSVYSHLPLLLVEDCPEDYVTTVRMLNRSGLSIPFYHCEDGDDALDFLYRRGPYTDPNRSPRPAIILLDLNLPGTDGREVLRQIKQDEDLKVIPVLVFTTSNHEADIKACYQAGANSYIQKPIDRDAFKQAMQRLKEYWFDVVLLPQGRS